MEKLGQYQIILKLKKSNSTETYQAWDSNRKQMVVIRLLGESSQADSESLSRYAQQMQRLCRDDRFHFGRFLGFESIGGKCFAVREYVVGQAIHELARQDPFSGCPFLNLALQITRGVKQAHDHGICHGAIASSNIIVSPRGSVKLLDFALPSESTRKPAGRERESTRSYRAPEREAGGPADEAGDLYSLGVVFHEMLTGQLPPRREDQLKAPTVASALGGESTDDIMLLIRRLLSKNPADRSAGAGELLSTLEEMLAYRLQPPRPQQPPADRRSPRAYLTLSVLTALLVIFWLVITSVR